MTTPSLPSRERGLKYQTPRFQTALLTVAPLAGAWIEISLPNFMSYSVPVAPLAGAWIEISVQVAVKSARNVVAPLAGAWIEMDR